jgi:O-acetylhomoserine/O-acetylserine sulfhydrylase-like pyridoxal-dependent enzyme
MRQYAIYQTHSQRFGSVDEADREEQIQRIGQANQARQHPTDAELGDQSAAGKGGLEAYLIRGEAITMSWNVPANSQVPFY